VRATVIDRNYAETLLALAQRHGGDPTVDQFGDALEELTRILAEERRVREFLESPLVELDRKKNALRKTLAGRAPELFIRFLLVVVEKRRAAHLRGIALKYRDLVDELRGRMRAEVTLARAPDAALEQEIRTGLERMLAREVLVQYRVDEKLIGGVVVRVGDQILDGSVRRRLGELRRRLVAVELPGLASA
jgi:F-type H+-transporting ATPase subunit delta